MSPFDMLQSCGAHMLVYTLLPIWMHMVLEVTELFLTSWVMNLLDMTVMKAVKYETLTPFVLECHSPYRHLQLHLVVAALPSLETMIIY